MEPSLWSSRLIFLIADTFTESLARLTGEEQKLVKTTVFDLQVNPASPGHQLHKLDQAKDRRFWSVRVGSDIRLIVHRQEGSFLVCYVDHHDKAYEWAQRRKLETHPRTGAAQFVEIRETFQEIRIPKSVEATASKPLLFRHFKSDDLLGVGVPNEWIPDVLQANEDLLMELLDRLPQEASEALLEMATGGRPLPKPVLTKPADPFEHPDAQRRFRIMDNREELERALEAPWEKWTIFLHPDQRQMVEKEYTGPARVSGSAGTGKTIVALHRAVHLVRKNSEARVLLCTFSEALAEALQIRMRRLIHNEPMLGERLDVFSLDALALRFAAQHRIPATLLSLSDVKNLLMPLLVNLPFKLAFALSEWKDVVDLWQLSTWEEYRDAPRQGRKTRLKEAARMNLWKVFSQLQTEIAAQEKTTLPEIYKTLATLLKAQEHHPYDHVVVDEAQDIGPMALQFLAAIAGGRPNGLFFAGDTGQRIFQVPFPWKSQGVEIRGRSRTLKVNYRTSHQIRCRADLLLGPETTDGDGNTESRKGTISVFNGIPPEIRTFETPEAEQEGLAAWLQARTTDGVVPSEIGVFVRSKKEMSRAQAAMELSGIPCKILDTHVSLTSGYATIGTMHFAKGLEFRVVAVMACDDEVIPSQERIGGLADDAELEEVYNTERHMLYVACTRARDFLWVSAAEYPSEFLKDLASN